LINSNEFKEKEINGKKYLQFFQKEKLIRSYKIEYKNKNGYSSYYMLSTSGTRKYRGIKDDRRYYIFAPKSYAFSYEDRIKEWRLLITNLKQPKEVEKIIQIFKELSNFAEKHIQSLSTN